MEYDNVTVLGYHTHNVQIRNDGHRDDENADEKHGNDQQFFCQASCSCVPIHAGAFSQLEASHNLLKKNFSSSLLSDLNSRLGLFSSQLRVFSLSSPLFSATGELLHT